MISVILPVYNTEQFLGEAIESVLAQDFHDWELVIVDDGSTDSSGNIADDYAAKDSRIKVFHVENGGLSYARNFGLSHSTGQFVTFLDSDDVLHANTLALLHKIIVDSGADYVIGGFCFEAKCLETRLNPDFKMANAIDVLEEILYQLKFTNSACGKLFKRELFEKVRFTEGRYYEDLEFIYNVSLKCKSIAYTSAPVYFYRQHSGSFIHSWTPKRLDVLRVTDYIEADAEKFGSRLLMAARDRKLSANFNMFNLALANRDKQLLEQCWGNILKYRKGVLLSPRGRVKVKAAALLSYFGKPLYTIVAKWLGA